MFSSSGDQVYGSELVVQVNSTSTTVYDTTLTTFSLYHTVAGGTLTNNITYKAKIRTKNSEGTYTSYSDWVLFKPLITPIISITNVTEGGTVNNQTYTFLGSFSQTGSSLRSYQFNLYDANEVLLESYDTVYSTIISQEVTGLINGESYRIELQTLSQAGISSTTGLIQFTASFISPTLNGGLELVNNSSDGTVSLTITAIQFFGTGSGYTFSNNDWVNLTASGSYVRFEEMLDQIDENFTLRVFAKGIPTSTTFVRLYSNDGDIQLQYYNSRFHVFKTAYSVTSHFISTTDITFISTDEICIEVKSINNLINITAAIVS